MKHKPIYLSLATLASLAICACHDPVLFEPVTDDAEPDLGRQAFVSVRLLDADAESQTRGTAGNFEYGTDDEDEVSNAWFYFYDEQGTYVCEGSVWDGGTASDALGDGNVDKNIEFRSKTVVVLDGLSQRGYPKYMVTVLNRPEGFVPAVSLDLLKAQLIDEDGLSIYTETGERDDEETASTLARQDFVMSSVSYFAEGRGSEPAFVTELDDEDFLEEPIPDDLESEAVTPVDVYVERLAAKVQLTTSVGTVGKVTESVVDEATEGVDEYGEERALQITVLGWRLNGTAKRSNVVKSLDDSWASAAPFTDWNDEDHHRSYWGMSFNYGTADTDYPTSAALNTATGEYSNDGTELNPYVDFVSLAEVNGLDDVDYCAENTNSPDQLSQGKYSTALTNVLVKARLELLDEEGNPVEEQRTFVLYDGVLFEADAYMDFVISSIRAYKESTGDSHYFNYYLKDEETDEYYLVNHEITELVDAGDGNVNVAIRSDLDDIAFYVYNPLTRTYSSTLGSDLGNAFSDMNSLLQSFNEHAQAVGYKDGLMYYTIPIEHLNAEAAEDGALAEGNYGVVRNHFYNIDITGITRIGHGIFDEEEVIVPDPEDSPEYYLTTHVNVLPWQQKELHVSL